MTHELSVALERLDAYMEQFLSVSGTPGISIAVTDREKTLHVRTLGYSDISARTQVKPETLFQIGSIGKSFASVCIMQLVEEGKVKLDTPVTEYIPWLKVGFKPAVFTLHHLMTHTAGIVLGSEYTLSGPPGVLALEATSTGSTPGEFFHYSNVGYKIVGLVLEQVLRKPIGEILRERLLDKLEMDSTEPTITNDTRTRSAIGHVPFYDDRPSPLAGPLVEATWIESDTADGSISSTPGDMAKYVRMHLNRGQGPTGRIISEESYSLMAGKHVPQGEDYPGEFYGYGLGIEDVGGHTIVKHTGGMVGFVSSMRMDLDDGLGLIVMLNSRNNADDVAKFGAGVLCAAASGLDPAALPSRESYLEIQNAADYVGRYADASRSFSLLAEGRKLVMQYRGRSIALLPRDKGMFFVDHPDFHMFLLGFGKTGPSVTNAFHGPRLFFKGDVTRPKAFKYPKEWEAFTGHFRSYNPWLLNFRIVPRSGALQFVDAQSGIEEPLVQLGPGKFRIGRDERIPETITFDQVVNSRAQRAILSCGDPYFRVPTP